MMIDSLKFQSHYASKNVLLLLLLLLLWRNLQQSFFTLFNNYYINTTFLSNLENERSSTILPMS